MSASPDVTDKEKERAKQDEKEQVCYLYNHFILFYYL